MIGRHLLRYRETELYSIPSVHCDVVFADLVIKACVDHAFDLIAVELPSDIDQVALAAAVDALWPTPGVAVCGAQLHARGMLDTGPECGGDPTTSTPVHHAHVLPIVPCDSIAAAIWASQRVPTNGGEAIPLEFLDLPACADWGGAPRTPVTLRDTWLVARDGLQAYLDAADERIASGRCQDDDAREREMARRLRFHVDAGRRVLFVCGLGHWRRIATLLDADPPVTARGGISSGGGRIATLQAYSIPAAQAWWQGFMGIPALVAEFVRPHARSIDPTARFDLPAAFARIEFHAIAEAQATEGLGVSPRQAQVFRGYLMGRLGLGGRFTPFLDGDIHHAAESCVGERWADALKTAALWYPYDVPPSSMPRARLVRQWHTTYLVADGCAYAMGRSTNGADGDQEHRSLPSSSAPLSASERAAAGLLPAIRSVPPEDHLQRAMIRWAWQRGDGLWQHRRSKFGGTRRARFRGDLGRGIDWRRTLRAWTEGEPQTEFFVKAVSRRGRPGRVRPRPVLTQEHGRPCPVAWIFAPAATIEHRVSARMFDTYSSFYWLRDVARLAGGITRETVGYCVNVLRGRSDWDEASVRAMLAALPVAERPRVAPWNDRELERFHGPDLAVAAAIRWARNRAIVVADPDFGLALRCQAYARKRGVDLVKISWDAFGDEARRRLAMQHTAPSRSHFADPPSFVLRVIPAVPQFNPPRGAGERPD